LKSDKEIVLAAVTQNGNALQYASDDLKGDQNVVFAAFKQKGYSVEGHMSVREMILAAVRADGNNLQFASNELREDREVVLAAVRKSGAALKFALGELNQDSECLKASGLWDEGERQYSRNEQAILSVKFSLAEQSTPYASQFALAMKNDAFLKNFKTYNPNAWCKESCDPEFTNINHPCRGTRATCTNSLPNTNSEGKPCATSCWRFAFRFHQEVSKDTNGFMIQVQEKYGLGAGQQIETQMAQEAGIKVFRAIDTYGFFDKQDVEKTSKAVKAWYDSGCSNMDLEIVEL